MQLANQGKYAEAEALLRKSLANDRERLGATHLNTVDTTENLAVVLDILGRPNEAEPLHRQTVTIRQKQLGHDAPDTLRALTNLGTTLVSLRQFDEAISILERAVDGSVNTLGEREVDTLVRLNELGVALSNSNRAKRAEQVLVRAVTVGTDVLGRTSPRVLTWSINLAKVWTDMARFDEADALYLGVIEGLSRENGPYAPKVLSAKNNYAFSLMSQGRIRDAEPLFRELLAVREKSLGPLHPGAMTARKMLGNALVQLGRGDEVLSLRGRSLDLLMEAVGPEHPYTLGAMRDYANALGDVGRTAEAQSVRERTLALSIKVFGEKDENTLMAMNEVAIGRKKQGQFSRALELLQASYKGIVELHGVGHPRTVQSAINLSSMLSDTGKTAEAITLLEETREEMGSHRLANPEQKMRLAFNLSSLQHDTGRPDAAVRTLDGFVAKADEIYGPGSPLPQMFRVRLAESMLATASLRNALMLAREAHQELGARLRHAGNLSPDKQQQALDQASRAAWVLISAAWAAAEGAAQDAEAEKLAAEAFEAAQTMGLGPSAFAISRGAGRVAAQRRSITPLLEAWNDAQRDLAAFETQSIAVALGAGPAVESAAQIRQRLLERVDSTAEALDAQFPEFFGLINPRIVPVTDLLEDGRSGLAPDEALILFLPGPEAENRQLSPAGFVWAITRDGIAWARLDISQLQLERTVSELRHSISNEERLAALGRAPVNPIDNNSPSGEGRFDAELAHELFLSLFGDSDLVAAISSKHRWLIAPQGSLLSLPFGALVTEPQQIRETLPETLRNTSWLGAERALTILPSLQLLYRSRNAGEPYDATRLSYIGFGDPEFGGVPTPLRLANDGQFRSASEVSASLRELPRLPGSRTEVLSLASAFGATDREVFLGSRASENELMLLNQAGRLGQARILHFATHGLISGDFDTLTEPALALTPPGGSEAHLFDGLLTATEVASLSLDADWVLLSACNTAAGQEPGAEGLSGLSRAFFYAGAKNMLVTHWAVRDDLASRLMVEVIAPSEEVPYGEAMRKAIVSLIGDTSEDHRSLPLAHPINWAAFQLVGFGP